MDSEFLRIGQAAGLLGVSVDSLRRWEADGRIAVQRSPGGQRVVAFSEIRRLLGQRRAPRPAIAAQSARNQFDAVVTEVVCDAAAALVRMQAGPHSLVALITADSVEELGLAPGVEVVASVKATNVVVGLPGPGR
ncbi:MAG TPA: helix-turn-helix transcriptional regulator [Egibacteraceae bacterium]|nr:helix-turn-helix transcriptional regulator [Egibacteraceae bacterium]